MNKRIKFLLVIPLLTFPAWVMAQSDQTYATYITEEQWQMVNELPGVGNGGPGVPARPEGTGRGPLSGSGGAHGIGAA